MKNCIVIDCFSYERQNIFMYRYNACLFRKINEIEITKMTIVLEESEEHKKECNNYFNKYNSQLDM
jgi:hypothetical protein